MADPADTAVIGLDIGGTDIKSMLADRAGTELARGGRRTPVAEGVPAVIEAIVDEIESLRVAAGPERTVSGVGLIFPGVVDSAAGIARYATNIGWRELPIRDVVSGRVGLPVAIDHDVRAAGLAEIRLGAAHGAREALYLAIGTGISAAVITRGEVVTGAAQSAGEIGHLPAFPDGEPCACGQRGCCEVYASGSALPRRYLAAGGAPAIDGKPLRAPEVLARAAAGDRLAAAVFDDAITALARTLTAATLLTDPELIVLGGGLMGAGAVLLDPLADRLQAGLAWRPAPRLLAAKFGADSGRVGAALVGWQAAGHAPLPS